MRFYRPPLVLWRYITMEIVAILIVTLVVQLLMNAGIVAFRLVQQEGLQLSFIWPILFKLSTISLYYSIPISLLFAVTLGVGRMVADLEITALKASGVSYVQLAAPVFILGICCSIFTQYLNGEIIPPVRFQRRNLKKLFLRQLSDLGTGGNMTISLPKDMGQIICRRHYGNVLEDVQISVWNVARLTGGGGGSKRQKFPVTIRARWARIHTETDPAGRDRLVVELEGAEVTAPDSVLHGGKGDVFFLQRLGIDRSRLPIPLTDSTPGTKDKRSSVLKKQFADNVKILQRLKGEFAVEKDLDTLDQLKEEITRLEKENLSIQTELARRRAFAFSCFTFLWLGLPLTVWLNSRNRLVPFFMGNLAAIGLFYPLVTLGLQLVKKGYPPGLMVQTGNIALFILGAVLLWRLRST